MLSARVSLFTAVLCASRLASGADVLSTLPAELRTPVKPAVITFPLDTVTIDGGPCKTAQEVDTRYLLKLNPDSLLHYVRINAGLKPKAGHYGGWETNGSGIIGHYLSACAQMAAATNNPELRRRVDYIVNEFADCQAAGHTGALYSFGSDKNYFHLMSEGKLQTPPVNGWYVMHKTMAGARDAYLLTGNPKAKLVWLDLCDWAVDVTSTLTEAQWQLMLDGEHGAPQEVLADAYAVTGNVRYLRCAERFCHHKVFDPLTRGDDSVLNGLHANTNITKFVGYERVYEMNGSPEWGNAAANFWKSVVDDRSWVLGGNSQWEAFFNPKKFPSEMQQVCGPETCNSYNMLKLTQMLFRLAPDPRAVDFYERCLFNHILSTENFDHGGFVYYTSMRPGGYRTTSTDYGGFWCCVGTGMENHARYGEMVYARSADETKPAPELYVNLFIPSTLTWSHKGLTLQQSTAFPEAGSSTLQLHLRQKTKLDLKIRYPGWVAPGAMKINVNGATVELGNATPDSYVSLTRNWKDGDRIQLTMPMRLAVQPLPYSTDHVALLDGPIVLAGAMGNAGLSPEDFQPQDKKSNMLAHKQFPESDAPVCIASSVRAITTGLSAIPGHPLEFSTGSLTRPASTTLMPMWRLGDQRYVTYFEVSSAQNYAAELSRRKDAERAALQLEHQTIDHVRVGEQQPEADHHLQGNRTSTGNGPPPYEHWRDASDYFSYDLGVDPARGPVSLRCVYWGDDRGRTFDVLVDNHLIATQQLNGAVEGAYFSRTYPIPPALISGRSSVTVTFRARPGSQAGGVFDVRTLAGD